MDCIDGVLRTCDAAPIFRSNKDMVALLKLLAEGIYVVRCDCGKYYIGETGMSVGTVIKEQEGYILWR